MNEVRTYTAAPGKPIPPIAVIAMGTTIDSTGLAVAPRIQVQVAPQRDVAIAEFPGREGVPELVQAQRHHPAGDHEDEHREVGQRPHIVADPVGQRAAQHGQADDGPEDRAGPNRLMQIAGAHATKLPDQQPTLGVPVDRRAACGARRNHAIADHRDLDATQLCGPAGQPAARPAACHAGPQPGQRRRRLDPHPGHVAVEQHRRRRRRPRRAAAARRRPASIRLPRRSRTRSRRESAVPAAPARVAPGGPPDGRPVGDRRGWPACGGAERMPPRRSAARRAAAGSARTRGRRRRRPPPPVAPR